MPGLSSNKLHMIRVDKPNRFENSLNRIEIKSVGSNKRNNINLIYFAVHGDMRKCNRIAFINLSAKK